MKSHLLERRWLIVCSELVTKWCGPVVNPATAYQQVDRVYRRDIEDVPPWAEPVMEEEGQEAYNTLPHCLDGHSKDQCWVLVDIITDARDCDEDEMDKPCVVATTHKVVQRVWRRGEADMPIEVDENLLENDELQLEGDGMPLKPDDTSLGSEEWLLENGAQPLESDNTPVLNIEEPDLTAQNNSTEKPQFMRPLSQVFKPDITVVARAQEPEVITVNTRVYAETPLPRTLPGHRYPHPYPVAYLPVIDPTPISDLLPVHMPEADEGYLPMGRSPVPPPVSLEDCPWPFVRASANGNTATSSQNADEVSSKYGTPPVVDSAVRHMPILPRQPEDDDEEYGTVNGIPLSDYSRHTPAITMPTASEVYRRQVQSHESFCLGFLGEAKKEKRVRLGKNQPVSTPALTQEGKMKVFRRQPDFTDSMSSFTKLKDSTSANPAEAMPMRRGSALKDHLKATLAETATTLATVAVPMSTLMSVIPSPSKTPLVDIHTLSHESTYPLMVDKTGATTHPRVTHLYDNPPALINERRGINNPTATHPGESASFPTPVGSNEDDEDGEEQGEGYGDSP
jgi:hypothetical protein